MKDSSRPDELPIGRFLAKLVRGLDTSSRPRWESARRAFGDLIRCSGVGPWCLAGCYPEPSAPLSPKRSR